MRVAKADDWGKRLRVALDSNESRASIWKRLGPELQEALLFAHTETMRILRSPLQVPNDPKTTALLRREQLNGLRHFAQCWVRRIPGEMLDGFRANYSLYDALRVYTTPPGNQHKPGDGNNWVHTWESVGRLATEDLVAYGAAEDLLNLM